MLGLWIQALQLHTLLAVVLHSPAPAPELLEAATQSCSEALGVQRCYRPDDREPGADAIEAWVSWDEGWLAARLELRRAGQPEVLSVRDVTFSRADALDQRFRALGLIVASHVLSQLEPQPEPPPSEPRRFDSIGLDLAVFAGPGLDRGPPRVGLLVRGWLRPWTWPLGLLLGVRGASRPEQPRLFWAGVSAGAALHLEAAARLALEARAELVGQRTAVFATDPGDGQRARAGAMRWGGQLGAELSMRVGARIWLFGGGELSWLRPRVEVRIAGEAAGAEPRFGWALLAGSRLSWP